MFVAAIPNRGSPPAILLREGYREGGKVKTRTLANLSKLPNEAIEAIKRILKGENLLSSDELFEIVENGSKAYGHVDAVLTAMRRLGFDRLINSRSSRQRDLVVSMVAARILKAQSKIATTRWWSSTTLPEMFGVSDADEDELYKALDWLLERQENIEKKLAARHLEVGGMALYDLSSSYFEGSTCPLAKIGHNRDGKKGKLQVNYGLLTNTQGIPVSISVFDGNVGDPKTVMPQVDKMQDCFDIEEFILVGDRGMLTQKQIDELRETGGIDWVGALRPEAIKKLVSDDTIQLDLFDEKNLFEFVHLDFPGERLVACRNESLARKRKLKRKNLLSATVKALGKIKKRVERGRLQGKVEIRAKVNGVLKNYKVGKHYGSDIREDGFDCVLNESALEKEVIENSHGDLVLIQKRLARYKRHGQNIEKKLAGIRQMIERGRLYGEDKIGLAVGKIINKYKVAKHFKLNIKDNEFNFVIDEDKVKKEAALDGIYVVRTSLPKSKMSTDEIVRSYKQLSNVERAFRSIKTVDLMVRPIYHHHENRVRAHIFLCMLAYYVQWHMKEAWRPLLFADEDQEAKTSRDPVAPAQRSEAAIRKVRTKKLDDGSTVHSFHTLLEHLGEIIRNTCRTPGCGKDESFFQKTTTPNPKQQKALELLRNINL